MNSFSSDITILKGVVNINLEIKMYEGTEKSKPTSKEQEKFYKGFVNYLNKLPKNHPLFNKFLFRADGKIGGQHQETLPFKFKDKDKDSLFDKINFVYKQKDEKIVVRLMAKKTKDLTPDQRKLFNELYGRIKLDNFYSDVIKVGQQGKIEASITNPHNIRGTATDDEYSWMINSAIELYEKFYKNKNNSEESIKTAHQSYDKDRDRLEEVYVEGKQNQYVITHHERNTDARLKCLEKYGYSCNICNFNFEDVYGDIGKNYIHVHHIEPISQNSGEYEVDPIKDLIPVCPNCHVMLHTKHKVTIEQLKKIVDKQKQ